MAHLPSNASDDDLIRFIDYWAELMEQENYVAAYGYTQHIAEMKWSPELIRQAVKSYGRSDPVQKVTLAGKPTDITQRKEVSRFTKNRYGEIAEIWYDINLDGYASDLTATFRVVEAEDGLVIKLNDIHVM
jgi:hypothetical protein